ncbi:MAG: hypothetical protein ABJB05_06865 [Parafilimonas sp.]
MKKSQSILVLLTGLLFFGFTFKDKDEIKDYLNVPGPLTFDNTNYNLAWSSHSADNYYIQEYIPQGDNLDSFNKMVLINVIISDSIKLNEVVAAKISELTEMQKKNPVIQFKAYDNKKTGEHIIDFLLSENEAEGNHLKLVERNVYRYKEITDKSGKKGILLFGTSTRNYGHDIYGFFADLKEHRSDIIMKVGDFAIPEITITK